MYGLILALGVFNCLVFAAENRSNNLAVSKNTINNGAVNKNNIASHHNISYIDKAENMLRTPTLHINKLNEEHKKKKQKKSPKTTIQKIIKKNRAKLQKRLYFSRMPIKSTIPIDYDKIYQEEKREEGTTTQVNQRKRSRKYSPKVAGYHMPFQKLRAMKEKRNKRGLSRELYILKDLDEIEFLSKEDGDDVVKAHVKNIW